MDIYHINNCIKNLAGQTSLNLFRYKYVYGGKVYRFCKKYQESVKEAYCEDEVLTSLPPESPSQSQ